ncbi:unnamed protein product [Orchesella dallaii]|uniref:Uncharacterized protein n=1 Tax=Orchesella dallaii TaxID=48710 RepID=A0ABP1QMN0_9HEXA
MALNLRRWESDVADDHEDKDTGYKAKMAQLQRMCPGISFDPPKPRVHSVAGTTNIGSTKAVCNRPAPTKVQGGVQPWAKPGPSSVLEREPRAASGGPVIADLTMINPEYKAEYRKSIYPWTKYGSPSLERNSPLAQPAPVTPEPVASTSRGPPPETERSLSPIPNEEDIGDENKVIIDWSRKETMKLLEKFHSGEKEFEKRYENATVTETYYQSKAEWRRANQKYKESAAPYTTEDDIRRAFRIQNLRKYINKKEARLKRMRNNPESKF